MKIHINKIGSDAEFVFARVIEFQPQVVSAADIISANKAKALLSFIGTDNHAATAEIRPAPAHNIKRHLYDIAAAIDSVSAFLKERHDQLGILAHPMIGEEPLGGHIHVSLFAQDSLTKLVTESFGRIYGVSSSIVPYSPHLPPGSSKPPMPEIPTQYVPIIEEYCRQGWERKLVTAWTFFQVVHYLAGPFEYWIQPWYSRRHRNSKYGLEGDAIRFAHSVRPSDRLFFKEWAYLHFEYRSPSTWLIHPWLAYAYLALVKISLVNWNLIMKRVMENSPLFSEFTVLKGKPSNQYYRNQLYTRLEDLSKHGLRIPNDCKMLIKTLKGCEQSRQAWFSSPTPIDVTAWRELL